MKEKNKMQSFNITPNASF